MNIKKFIFDQKAKHFPDKKFRRARIWSNNELKKIAEHFSGEIINVSGWNDEDKTGGRYADYFTNKSSYKISNYPSAMGYQGKPGEIMIDLEKDLDPKLVGAFDVVFNHTTLEHVYEVQKAFKNLCEMTRDIVIVVVPWLQQLHYGEGYKDYWRISPFTLKRMFEDNGMELEYISGNNNKKESVYVIAVGSKKPQNWAGKFEKNDDIFINLGDKIIK